MSLPSSLSLKQWERRRIVSSVKTQSGALVGGGPGINVSWQVFCDSPGIIAIFPVDPQGLEADLVAIGASNPRQITIQESAFGVDPQQPGAQYNKSTKQWPIQIVVTADPLQIPDANLAAE